MAVLNRDCSNDPEAEKELAALGVKSLPVSVRGDQMVIGFNVEELREAFGIETQAAGPLPAARMLELYRMVFEGARRAVRQIPQEKFDWVSPGRKRTLRQLTWHIFERPDLCMGASETGDYTQEMVMKYETLAEDYRTAGDICAYADQIEVKLADFLENERDRLAKKIVSYMGPVTVHELLEMALGHAVQHIRHTYHYFGLLGIEPDRPLVREDYEGVPVPEELF